MFCVVTALLQAVETLRNRDVSIVTNGIRDLTSYCNGRQLCAEKNVLALAHNILQSAGNEATLVTMNIYLIYNI